MIRKWSFCKRCEKYHIDWNRNNLDARYETHLTDADKADAISFPIYKKEISGMSGVYMICADKDAMTQALLQYPSGVYEPANERR